MDETKKHKKICEQVFSHAGKRQAEVIIFSSENALTRFAENAVSMLKMQKSDPLLLPLAKPQPLPKAQNLFDAQTACFSPVSKAEKLAELVQKCKSRGQLASGTISNGWTQATIANSKGVFATHRETAASFNVTVKDGGGMGWAGQYDPRISGIDFEKVGDDAGEKARLAKNPRPITPGRHTVILEPNAVANMLFYAGIFGFGGQFFLEGQSFLSGKIGRKVLGENMTIEDNGIEGRGAGMPFDFEGMPRQKVMLIENGIAKAAVHDRKTAKKAGMDTTGHALPQPNSYGPIPMSLVLKPGKPTLEEMIKSTKQGILVTQFHYVNLLKPLTLDITGMTRNGTYMIENGRISYPVKNMRFTESVVAAFNRVEEIGCEHTVSEAFFGGKFLVPPLKIKDFNFSSSTEF